MITENKVLADILAKYLAAKAASIRQELEGIDESLSELVKIVLGKEPEKTQKPTEAQFNGQNWITKHGTKGDYQQVENDKSESFRTVSQYVKAKSGFCNLYGFKVWLHNSNEDLIDRKR